MPCYDKKLEASRSDFYNEVYSTRDVDCVITTGELERLVQENNFNLSEPIPRESDPPYTSQTQTEEPPTGPEWSEYSIPELLEHAGSSSGSYLQSIISHITHISQEPLELSVKQIRNADYEEYILRKRRREGDRGEAEMNGEGEEGEVVFKGAKCYGFRNLQNVVRKVGKESGIRTGVGAAGRLAGRAKTTGIRRGRKGVGDVTGTGTSESTGYDYIEVMACPGGCINGGGQLKPPIATPVSATATPGGASLDEEGFTRDWASEGVSSDVRWGNREWNRKVEEAYWRGLASPVTSGTSDGDNTEAAAESGEIKLAGQGSTNHMTRITDQLYIDITIDLSSKATGAFRTQYRAVESEVIGLAVKW